MAPGAAISFPVNLSAKDPYAALAREHLLLDAPGSQVPAMRLWRGNPAVILGKNQNPWMECNWDVLREKQLRLARRVTGGGSVYHDPGNLNLTWIFPRAEYRKDLPGEILCRALADCGLPAEDRGSAGVFVRNRKVSGVAYCYRRQRVLHHATLLLQADLDTLRAALAPRQVRMRTHAVTSRPAAVANLADFSRGLTMEMVVEALREQALRGLGARVENLFDADLPLALVEAETARMASSSWILGQTPAFAGHVRLPGACLEFAVRLGILQTLSLNGRPVRIGEGLRFLGPDFFASAAKICALETVALRALFQEAGWAGDGNPPDGS